jgi:polyribonucleotide nucleotidyltransferase
VKVGDKLRVEIADIDNRGKISLVLVADDEAAEASNGDGPASDTDTAAAPADAATASS